MKAALNWALAVCCLLVASLATASSLPDFTQLVENNYQAVVNISTSKRLERHPALPPGTELPDFDNTPFGDLLRRFFEEYGDGQPAPEDATSLGSGFIITEDGYVLTNNHVIEDADEIIVRLHDRRQLVAELVGADQRSDIALLKIDAKGLPKVEIGLSERLKVGEWVLAIGSPFGFDFSVTAGIVSAKGRSLPNENYVPFIQTDVAINPGNSGGPLFNLDGEVVGINSQIYSRTGGFMGLSFAIPIEVAMNVAEQIRETGRVSRGWLGVIIQEVTRDLAESFGMDKAQGALITQVLADSPAANSDLQVGDVIVAFNGSEVQRSSALPPLVGRTPVGSDARVDVIRDGQRQTVIVHIGELPERIAGEPGTEVAPKAEASRLNLDVVEPDEQQREELAIAEGGVLVRGVAPGPALDAGIRAGDAILQLNNRAVTDLEQFRQLVDELPAGRSVPVLVQRDRRPLFLALRLPEVE
jgi:serine protease Do